MLLASLTTDEIRIRKKLRDDLRHYAKKALKIRTKSGSVEPFVFNRAQEHIHDMLEAQKERTGKVRALILKGRQQGVSTYIGGRFYHQTTHRRGVRTFILTHEDKATQNLYAMVQRYHEHCPLIIKPSTGAANANELFFDRLDAGYQIGTAGTKGVGRSSTIQLFHGSEAAFWPHAESHATGVMQAVPDEPGTEIILESTGNGVGNWFHQKWQEAETGTGDYIAIFVPWFWQPEYRRVVPADYALTDEEAEYRTAWDLDLEQMAWRRNKIIELRDPDLFRQEYPATASEAFRSSGHDSFIPAALIVKARKASLEAYGPLVIGYDPAWTGSDRHAMAWRRGRKVLKVETKSKLDTMQAAGWCKQVLDKEKPAKLFVDVGGVGAGVYDRLIEMGYRRKVEAVNFGSSPEDPPNSDGGGPLNRRAEIWQRSKQWLQDEGGADLPDEDVIQADACGPSYKYDSLTRLQLERKEDMRRRGVKSPDIWDAVALTFASAVQPSAEEAKRDPYDDVQSSQSRGWMAA